MMLKIAFNASPLLSPLTGIGQYTKYLLDELMLELDLNIQMFASPEWTSVIPGVRQQKHHNLIRRFARQCIPFAYSVSRYLQQYHFSLGVKNNHFDLYHEPNFLAFDFDGPMALTVHDLSWIRFPEAHPKARVQAMHKFFEPSLKKANVVITDSEFVKQELISVFGIDTSKIKSVPLGVSSNFCVMSPNETKQTLDALKLKHGQYFLALGTLEPRKNLHVTINAFMRLPQKIRQAHPLVLVGMKGWGTSELEKKLAPLLLLGEVIQLGYLPQDDLHQVTAGALALVYASIYEGFGLPPLEAMACGVPVITSNVSSIPEVVGQGGVMLDPTDVDGFTEAMRMVVEAKDVHKALSISALAQSKNFSWKKCAMGTIEAYHLAMARA